MLDLVAHYTAYTNSTYMQLHSFDSCQRRGVGPIHGFLTPRANDQRQAMVAPPLMLAYGGVASTFW